MMTHLTVFVIAAVISTLLTYWLNNTLKQGPVRASALIVLCIGGFFYFFPDVLDSIYTKRLPLYIAGASFIGMLSSTVGVSYFSLLLSPVLFSFLLHYMAKAFDGFGGTLGAAACVALMSTMAFPVLTKNKKVTYGYRLIRVLLWKRKRRNAVR